MIANRVRIMIANHFLLLLALSSFGLLSAKNIIYYYYAKYFLLKVFERQIKTP